VNKYLIVMCCVTVSRALGIPTRCVTNFDSAHDKDESMTIDYHFDEEGDFIGHMSDSVWYVSPFQCFAASESTTRCFALVSHREI